MTDPRKKNRPSRLRPVAERYLTWGDEIEGDPRRFFLGELARRLADGARVLDLGCGAAESAPRQKKQGLGRQPL